MTSNWRNLVLVLVNMPFALVGGVLAVFATGGLLTLGAMVGFVTLFGITLRNSIMMISHYEHLVEVEGLRWGVEAAIEGAGDRLAPILMTSLVTALGLLPLAIGMDDPGREVEGPMALVILGGLLTSMALNLLILTQRSPCILGDLSGRMTNSTSPHPRSRQGSTALPANNRSCNPGGPGHQLGVQAGWKEMSSLMPTKHAAQTVVRRNAGKIRHQRSGEEAEAAATLVSTATGA